jgi:hemoglobin-like flavoprotein
MAGADIAGILDFIGHDGWARARLPQLRPVLDAHMDGVIEAFYAELAKRPALSGMFRDDAVRRHAAQKQKEHWMLLFSGAFDDRYVESVRRIGRTHARIGLEPA